MNPREFQSVQVVAPPPPPFAKAAGVYDGKAGGKGGDKGNSKGNTRSKGKPEMTGKGKESKTVRSPINLQLLQLCSKLPFRSQVSLVSPAASSRGRQMLSLWGI